MSQNAPSEKQPPLPQILEALRNIARSVRRQSVRYSVKYGSVPAS